MNPLTFCLLCALVVMSFITFALFGIDKRRAKKGMWRISEKTLLLCAFFMGSPGALAGMRVFRHKTKHKKFTVLAPLFLVLNAGVIVWSLVR